MIINKVIITFLLIVLPSCCTHRMSDEVHLIEEKDFYTFETKVKCRVSTCSGEPAQCSFNLRGHLPYGIINYGFTKGYCFMYKDNDEVLVFPVVNQAETPDIPCEITLHGIELGTDYCMSYYDALSPHYSLLERSLLFLGIRTWKEFPEKHIAYILRGDLADIYVVAKEENVKRMLAVIVSGCKTTKEFDRSWDSFIIW